MKSIKTPIVILMLLSFLTVGIFGFLMMQGHHHEPGCPFMPGEKVICSMDVFDHIAAWQNTFTAPIPTIFLVLSAICLVFFITKYLFDPPDRLLGIPIRSKYSLGDFSVYHNLLVSLAINPRGP